MLMSCQAFMNKVLIYNFPEMDDFEWNVVNESLLFDAMAGHKPVGINKYFQMAFIWDKLTENIKKDVQSTKIWSHLETMYNLEALDENEALPFPNNESEFNLPDSEYGALKLKKEEKEKSEEKKLQKGRETPKMTKDKEIKKEEPKTSIRIIKEKEAQRRDSKDKETKEIKATPVKKEVKKEAEKPKIMKGRSSQVIKEETRRSKREESPRPAKRPTRANLKPEDGNNGTKAASPLTVTTGGGTKRRRML